jgi:hypothetical protein
MMTAIHKGISRQTEPIIRVCADKASSEKPGEVECAIRNPLKKTS